MRQLMVSQTKLLLAGSLGLLGSGLISLLAFLVRRFWGFSLPAPFDLAIIAWGTFFVFFALALLEIPLMIYALRQVAVGKSAHTGTILWSTQGLFVFFPAIYALPNLLLTNLSLAWLGLIIAAISVLRFISSLIFLRGLTTKE
jgi:hypothetical protein